MNKKLLHVGACALIISLMSACGSKEEREQQYLEKAQVLIKENNAEKARIELKNVLQINPKNIPARLLMAKLAEKDQDWQKMFTFLQSVITDKPDEYAAQTELGKLYLFSNDFEKAMEKAELVLSKDPQNIAGLNLKSATLLRKGEQVIAEQLAQQVLSAEPGNIEATQILIKLYDDTKRYADGLNVINNAITAHPEEASLAFVKLQLLTLTKKNDEAEKLAADLQQNFPKNADLHYSLAKYHLQSAQADKAENTLRALVNNMPEDHKPKLALIDFLISQNKKPQAEQELLQFSKSNPQVDDFSFALVNLYQHDDAKAITILNQIVESEQNNVSVLKAKNLLASYALKQGDNNKVRTLIDSIINEDAHNIDALMLRASLLLDEGKYDEAIIDLRSVQKDRPTLEKAHVLIARAHALSGSKELAQEALEKSLVSNPDGIDSRIELARLLANKNDLSGAIKLLATDSKNQPNENLLAALVDLYTNQNDWSNAEQTARKIAQTNKTGLADLKLAQVYTAQKQYPQAADAYQNALKLRPLAPDALTALFATYIAMNNPAKATATLEQLVKDHPEDIALLNSMRNNLAALLADNTNDPQQLSTALELVKSFKDSEQAGPLDTYAWLSFLNGQHESALTAMEKVIAMDPNSSEFNYHLGMIYAANARIDEAKSALQKAIAKGEKFNWTEKAKNKLNSL